MEFSIRDIVYIGVYLVTISVVWSDFKNSLNNTKNDVKKLNELFKDIIFTEKGGLNLVNIASCKEMRQEIQEDIIEVKGVHKEINGNIKTLNDNILIIMTKLEIDVKKIKNPNIKLIDSWDKTIEYILVEDNDGHGYVIPNNKFDDFYKWLEIDSDDERSWEAPEYAKEINGPYSNVKFKEYRID